ncbi:WSC-domain-containing protein [Panus rudis PR-1116 ss-1]|nr:WSC-domain-containing protein [Panus rudis PR-1116 ss-1]
MQRYVLTLVALFSVGAGVRAFGTPTIPLNWTTISPCTVDTGARIIVNDETFQLSDNTPASCIELCDSGDFVIAGVEFGNECHCGSGLKVLPSDQPISECNMVCTGDPTLSCGGPSRIQVYKSPALPPGSFTLQGCFIDTPSSPTFGEPIMHHLFPSNLDLISQCTQFCQHIGYPFAGVENAHDCQCSFGFADDAQIAPSTDCSSVCPLPAGAGNEFCGGVQRLMVYKYSH